MSSFIPVIKDKIITTTPSESEIRCSSSSNHNEHSDNENNHLPLAMDSGFQSSSSTITINNSLMQKKPLSSSSSSSSTISMKDNTMNNLDENIKLLENSMELSSVEDKDTLADLSKDENQKSYIENLNNIINTFNAKIDLNDNENDSTTVHYNQRQTIKSKIGQTIAETINFERRNSIQWPLGSNRLDAHYSQQQQQQRLPSYRSNNLYSKSAPMSNNWFHNDLINHDSNAYNEIIDWRLKNKANNSYLNPNANNFSPSNNNNNDLGLKIIPKDKIDKGALFKLDDKFFDDKERISSFRKMMNEFEYDDAQINRCPDSTPSTSLFTNMSTFANKNHQTLHQSDDLSFLFDNVLQKNFSTPKKSMINNKIIHCNDDEDDNDRSNEHTRIDHHNRSLSRSDNMNRSIFGNIHGLSSLINQPSVIGSERSSFMASISQSTAGSSIPLMFTPSHQQQPLQQRKYSEAANAIACVNDELEVRARKHREEASRVDQCQTIFEIGKFEFKLQCSATYSVKVFLGGVPWDMTNEEMLEAFRQFGAVSVQRPGIEVRPSRSSRDLSKAGYLYIIFDDSRSVERLISVCKITFDNEGSKFIYSLQSKRSKKIKNVQVIPWDKKDSSHYRPGFPRIDVDANNLNAVAGNNMIDESRMVFLGALHGMLNSKSIFEVLQEIFGPVDYVILETDRFDYPMGFGRAQFSTVSAYRRAIKARFVKVMSLRFKKTIQIDPYLEDQKCSQCHIENGPVFCFDCEYYFCRNCWTMGHSDPDKEWHKILMKKVSVSIKYVNAANNTATTFDNQNLNINQNINNNDYNNIDDIETSFN